MSREPVLKLRIEFGDRGMMGPGKAELLRRIRDTGSIAAAGREMGMSYKRAWTLVETMNAMFSSPVVARARGGARGGGATLTEMGERVLAVYATLAERAERAAAAEVSALEALLAEISDRK